MQLISDRPLGESSLYSVASRLDTALTESRHLRAQLSATTRESRELLDRYAVELTRFDAHRPWVNED
jgi:hypothetical protein